MKPYKLNVKAIIGIVGLLSLLIFSGLLILLGQAEFKSMGEVLLNYSFIIAPVTILWLYYALPV